MILDDIRLGPADRDGFCDVTAYRQNRMIDVVETIRLVPGVRVDWRTKSYRIPANCTVLPPLVAAPAQLVGEKCLREYQMLAVAEIERATKGYMVCYDVGVGKSLPVAYYLKQHPELRPFVIVAPLIAMNSWFGPSGACTDCGLTIAPLRSITPNDDKLPVAIGDRKVDGYFINFEILYVWGPWLHMKLDPKAIVVDEGHEMRNPRTVEAKAVRKLCRLKSVDMRLWLTATPVVNGVIDLYNQLDTVQPGMWGTMVPFNEKIVTSFGGRYCSAAYNGYGWSFGYESNVDELKHRLSSVLIRRTRAEVRKELPVLQREKIEIDPDRLDPVAWARYREAAAPTGGSSDVIGRLSRMANELSWAKRKMAVSQAESLAHGVEGHKIVVFCWYQRTAGYIAKELAKRGFSVFGPITGKMPGVKRLAEAERFKDLPLPSDGCAAYVATLAAAGMSLNPLSAAAAALFTDLYWVPTQLIQAEGRCIAEGQPVLTPEGWRPIETIKIGDVVITHTGRESIVVDAWSKGSQSIMTEIVLEGWPKPVITTVDHRFLLDDGAWKEAGDIRPGDRIAMPGGVNNAPPCKSIPFDDDCRLPDQFVNNCGKLQINGRLRHAPAVVDLTNDALFAFGYYAGDGHAVDDAAEGGRRVSVAGNKGKKRKPVAIFVRWMKSVGVVTSPYERKDGEGTATTGYSGEWARWFVKHFGCDAYNKRLPSFLLRLNRTQSRRVLDGLLASDGYYRDNRYEYSTVSPTLAAHVAILMLRAGYCPCVATGSTGQTLIAYTPGRPQSAFVESIKLRRPRKSGVGRERVYDLTVKDAASFVVGLASVHNCHREGQRAHQVLIQYLIVDDSMDTIMWEALQRKAKIIAKATDDKTALSLCESLGGRSEEETAAAFMHDLEALSDGALGLK